MGVLSRITGFSVIDELVTPIPDRWSVEFYGEDFLVNYLFHTTLAYNSAWRCVYAIVAKEYGGLDPGLLAKLCRIYGSSLTNIMVARAFRNEDLVNVLNGLTKRSDELIVVLTPYSYLPSDPRSYWKATSITGLLHQLSLRNQVVLFNTASKFGDYMPEGGSMHHHVVKIIVKLWRRGETCYAKLVKHSGRGNGGVRVFKLKLLENTVLQNTRTLLDWVRTST